jgi:hypothetical protein
MTNIQGSPRNFVVREGRAINAKSLLATLGTSPKARLAALHMQARTMRKPRSKRFPDAKAERRQKNDAPSSRRASLRSAPLSRSLYQCGDPLPRGKLKRLTADTKLWTRTDRPLPMSTATPIRAIPELAVSPGESVLEICEKNYLQAKRVLSKRSGQFGDTRSLT